MKIHRDIKGTEYWYDPQCHCWFGAKVDQEGNITNTLDAYKKEDIKTILKKYYGTK